MIEKIFKSLEYLFTMSSIILYTGGIINVLALDGLSEGEIDYNQIGTDNSRFFLVKFLYPITYAVAFILLTRSIGKSGKISAILSKNIFILLLVGWTISSTLWSEMPFMTISRSMALVGTTIFGIYLANRYTLKQQIVLLGHTFFAVVLLSIIFAIALPQYGLMGGIHAGAMRGIYTHKNEFGRLMSLSTLVFLMQPKPDRRMKKLELKNSSVEPIHLNTLDKSPDRDIPLEVKSNSLLQTIVIYLGLGLSILLLVLSRSSGAIVNLAIMSILLTILKIGQLRFYEKFIAALGIGVLFCIATIIIAPNPESLFASIGKSSDLTGRGDLWSILLDLLSKNPLLGFGYGAFWEKYGPIVALEAAWNAPDAHNGFLDLTLSVGLLGLILFILSYVYTLAKGFGKFRKGLPDEKIYPLIVLAYIIISNFSETGLFTCNHIFWLLYVTVSYSVIVLRRKRVWRSPKPSITRT